MEKSDILETLKRVRANSKKRNFQQSFDLIVNLKDLNLKNPDHQVDFFVTLHHNKGKKVKICGLVGAEMQNEAKKVLDNVIVQTDFKDFAQDKKKVKKLVREYDFFIAQANIMPQVATSFGRFLGPKGKMPNPKAGCIVPPNANLAALKEKLQKTVKVSAKTVPLIQVLVGTEDMADNDIVDNVIDIYNNLIHHLPSEENNIFSSYLKLTMSSSFKIGGKEEQKTEAPKKQKKVKKEEPKPEEKEKPKVEEKPVVKEEPKVKKEAPKKEKKEVKKEVPKSKDEK